MVNHRLILVMNTIIFQFKLGLDALRDILLSPISIILAVVDLITGNKGPQSLFYKLMGVGRQTDHWIGLFNAGDESLIDAENESNNVDYWLAKVEKKIRQQQASGKFTEAAKAQINEYLSKIHKDEK